MCLATAYGKRGEEEVVLAKNVSELRLDGEKIVMVDVLGRETEIEGTLERADLVNGVVRIRCA